MKGIAIWIIVFTVWVILNRAIIDYFSLESFVVSQIAILQADNVYRKYKKRESDL